MDFHIYLPIAGTSVNLFLLLGLGVVVGFLSGLFGVGGGFLLTPLLIMIGIPPTVAAASDSNQIVAASSSGTLAYWRRGKVDFKIGSLLLIGGIVGGTIGVQIIKILRASGNADFLIKIMYVLMLGMLGSFMFIESLQSLLRFKEKGPVRSRRNKLSLLARVNKTLPLKMRFEKSGVEMSIILPFCLGIIVGILAAVMGVGGGFIMVPAMIYILGMPVHVVVGTSLFQIFFTCVNVTFQQALFNHTVDFILALVLLCGSTIGAQFGARVATRLKSDHLKILLATIVLIVMIQMALGLLMQPETILSYMSDGGRH